MQLDVPIRPVSATADIIGLLGVGITQTVFDWVAAFLISIPRNLSNVEASSTLAYSSRTRSIRKQEQMKRICR
jgi:hypothetical protein